VLSRLPRGEATVKDYLLTAKGRKALTSETEQWQRQITAVARILKA
jgi:PadR family transcriptional regulator, regulatory protein PadR